MDAIIIGLLILAAIALFFLLREVFCWYYKINAIIDIMEEQRDLLKSIVEKEQLKQ
jgi:uncharacterized membrane protein